MKNKSTCWDSNDLFETVFCAQSELDATFPLGLPLEGFRLSLIFWFLRVWLLCRLVRHELCSSLLLEACLEFSGSVFSSLETAVCNTGNLTHQIWFFSRLVIWSTTRLQSHGLAFELKQWYFSDNIELHSLVRSLFLFTDSNRSISDVQGTVGPVAHRVEREFPKNLLVK